MEQVLQALFDQIESDLAGCDADFSDGALGTTRLLTLACDGTDQIASHQALARSWELVVPLPFGQRLNAAANGGPMTAQDARAVLAGKPATDPQVARRIGAINHLSEHGKLFELADQDEAISALFLTSLDYPEDSAAQRQFALAAGTRSALAGRILVEQSDIIIAVWDGKSVADTGGTGHTVATALELGAPVVWINPSHPEEWRILQAPEALADCGSKATRAEDERLLNTIIRGAVLPEASKLGGMSSGTAALTNAQWQDHSQLSSHAFRRVEALFGRKSWGRRFGSITQTYERPGAIARGSAAPLIAGIDALPDGDPGLSRRIINMVLRRFAWADGISALLSDRYRSGMTINFLLGAFAIISGIMYLPLVGVEQKWRFATVELILLLFVILVTLRGTRQRLHGRWFETRRAAEYLRHSPIMLAMGVARPPGAWPRGTKSFWPEWYARHSLRAVGLPETRVDKPYLKNALALLRDRHVMPQRDYHHAKAAELNRVHEGLDHLSGGMFILAVLSVAAYLGLVLASEMDFIGGDIVGHLAKLFTVLGVALPTLGGALTGIRFFGDFERFAAISEVAAEKLGVVADRIELLQSAPMDRLDYRHVSELVHAADEIVFSEIQNWQAVFSGKRITVPA